MFDESSFRDLSFALHEQLLRYIEQGRSYVVDVTSDELWAAYLESLPEDQKQVHDCSVCRKFFKVFGNIAWIQQGKLISLWDAPRVPNEYRGTIQRLSEIVHASKVVGYFSRCDIKPGLIGAPTRSKKKQDEFSDEYLHLCGFLPSRLVLTSQELRNQSEDITRKFEAVERLRQFPLRVIRHLEFLLDEGVISYDFRFKKYSEVVMKLLSEARYEYETELWSWEHLDEFPDGVTAKRGCLVKILEDLTAGKSVPQSVESYRDRLACGVTNQYTNCTPGLWRVVSPWNGKSHSLEDIFCRDFVSKVLPNATDLQMFFGADEIKRLYSISDEDWFRFINRHAYGELHQIENLWVPEVGSLLQDGFTLRVVADSDITLDAWVSGPDGVLKFEKPRRLDFDHQDLGSCKLRFHDAQEYSLGLGFEPQIKVGHYDVILRLDTDKRYSTREGNLQPIKFTLFYRHGDDARRVDFCEQMHTGDSLTICSFDIGKAPRDNGNSIARDGKPEKCAPLGFSMRCKEISSLTLIRGLAQENLFNLVKVNRILCDPEVFSYGRIKEQSYAFLLSGCRDIHSKDVGVVWREDDKEVGYFKATLEGEDRFFAVRFCSDPNDKDRRWFDWR